ncbi:MAG: hypothetical protein NTY09_09435 [bacterium]|nr:hypothetical protein [bacterium]
MKFSCQAKFMFKPDNIRLSRSLIIALSIALLILLIPANSYAVGPIDLGRTDVETEPNELSVAQEERIAQQEDTLTGSTEEGLTMDVSLGLSRYIYRTRYFPVTVTIENTGPSRTGEIRILSQDPLQPLSAIFKAECNIPSNSRKTYVLYPYILNSDPSPSIYVQYVEKVPLLTETIDLNFLMDEDQLWVEVADEGAAFTFLAGTTLPNGSSFTDISGLVAEETFSINSGYYGSQQSDEDQAIPYTPCGVITAWVRPASLPDRPEGYDGVAGLILNSRRFYELSEEQMTALMAWVLNGGQVIVWLGDDPVRYQSSFLTGAVDGGDWIGPSVITEPLIRTTLNSLSAIPGFTGNTPVPGSFPVTYTPQSDAQTLFAEGDVPILQYISFGRGDILLSGLDLQALKTVAPTGLDKYMSFMMGYLKSVDDRPEYIFKQDPSYNPYSFYGGGSPQEEQKFVQRSFLNILKSIDNVMQTDNLTALPGLGAITLFLAAYILLVGPINYFILLKMRRREWLWYTIPLVVAVFVILTYSWAYKVKGDKLLLTRVNVVDAYPEYGLGWQTSYFGLFSPASRHYDIHLSDQNDLIRGLEIPSISAPMYGTPDQTSQDDPLTLVQDGEESLAYTDNAYIRIWSERHFQSEGVTPNPGTVTANNVSFSGNHLAGDLDISLIYMLENPWLFYYTRGGYSTQNLESSSESYLSNGTYGFDLFLDMRNNDPDRGTSVDARLSPKENELRNLAIDIFESRRQKNSPMNEIVLAGFITGTSDRPISNPRVRSLREQTLVLVHIPLQNVSGTFDIDNASYHIIGIKAGDSSILQNGDLQLQDGEMLYSVTFPPITDAADIPESLNVTVGAGKAGGLFLFWAFDHVLNSWSPLPKLQKNGFVLTLSLSDVSRFLAPDGRTLLMKIEGNPNVDEDIISLNGILVDQ